MLNTSSLPYLVRIYIQQRKPCLSHAIRATTSPHSVPYMSSIIDPQKIDIYFLLSPQRGANTLSNPNTIRDASLPGASRSMRVLLIGIVGQ